MVTWSKTRSRRCNGARTRRSAGKACADSSGANCCASAARDLLGFAPVEVVERELTGLAEACLEAAVATLEPSLPFAVLGMGRLGGAELSYASDIDVLFVYDGDSPADFDVAERLAEALVTEIGATTAEGQTFRIDARLRPEGNQGPLARSLGGYAAYYDRWGLTWERQALSKVRIVAGDAALGARFCELANEVVYERAFTEEDAREIRRMKARIERERIPPGEDPQFHLKLGRGSLSDIEFLVQLLQLTYGGTEPSLRVPGTMSALGRLRGRGTARRRRRRRARSRVPVLRTGAERALPADREPVGRAADRTRTRSRNSDCSSATSTNRRRRCGTTTDASRGGRGASSSASSTGRADRGAG